MRVRLVLRRSPHPQQQRGERAGAAARCACQCESQGGAILTGVGIVTSVRIGVLTGGGDCPGLNAVIRAIVRRGIDDHGHEIVGFRDGWRGPIEDAHEELTIESTRGILPRGGTILRSSRTNPFKRDDGPERDPRDARLGWASTG